MNRSNPWWTIGFRLVSGVAFALMTAILAAHMAFGVQAQDDINETLQGVTVTPTELNIGEGKFDTYTVELNTQPTADVEITITSGDSRVEVSPDSLRFTDQNWNQPQLVTVTANEDRFFDDFQARLIHRVTGGDYSTGVTVDRVTVKVEDDDPQIVFRLVEVDPREFEEDVRSVRFSVVAETRDAGVPEFPSIVSVSTRASTANSGDGSCVPGADYHPPLSEQLTVGPEDYEAFTNDEGQTRYRHIAYFDVNIVSDHIPEGDESFNIVLEGLGGHFHVIREDDVMELTIIDDDFVGVAFEPTAISVTEGTTRTYRLALGSQPSGNVTVMINDPLNTEVKAEPGAVTFTPTDWYVPQTVAVSAEHDGDALDETGLVISHLVSSTDEDDAYHGLAADDVAVTVRDDEGTLLPPDTPDGQGLIPETETPGFFYALEAVEPVREDAGSLRIGVVVLTYPSTLPSDAEFAVYHLERTAKDGSDYMSSDDPDAELFELVALLFARDDFDEFVDINGDVRYRQVKYADIPIINDVMPEDTENFILTLSDPENPSLDLGCSLVPEVEVTIIDDDVPEVTVDPTDISVKAGGTSTYSVVLDLKPEGQVTVTMGGLAGQDLTLNKPSLTFTPQDWSVAKDVEVTSGHSTAAGQPQIEITHTVSSPENDYNGLDADSVTVTITSGVTVSPTTLTVVEGDTTGKDYTVILDSEPTSDVVIAISGDGDTDLTVSGGTLSANDELTFTSDNWSEPQRVTVKAGEDDDVTNDEETISHQVSAGSASEYVGGAIDSVTVEVTDNDALVTIAADVGSVTEGTPAEFTLTRSGKTDVALTVAVSVTETGEYLSGTAPTTATFDANDLTTSLTVATEDDSVDEANGSVTATLDAGTGYVVGAAGLATVAVADNDKAGVIVDPKTLTVVEGDTTGKDYTVVLDSEPTSDVVIAISGDGDTDLTVSGGTLSADDELTFTSDNWETPQRVTVTAGEDDDDATNDAETISHQVSAGSAAEYVGETIDGVTVTITDNDALVTIERDAASVTEGTSATFTLTRSGKTDVALTVAVSVTEMGDFISGTAPTTAAFLAGATTTSLTVATEGDSVGEADGSVTAALEAGTGYVVGAADQATVTVEDDDKAGVTVDPTTLTVKEGDTDGESYTVKLDLQPSGDVTVAINSDAGTILILSGETLSADDKLTFTTDNWSEPQTVNVEATDDNDLLDNRWKLTHTPSGGGYSTGVEVETVTVDVTDDDPQVVFSLFEEDPIVFEEGVGTVRVGILAETNEAGEPTDLGPSAYGADLFSKASRRVGCQTGQGYIDVIEQYRVPSKDFVAFVNDDGETRYRHILYHDVQIIDDQVEDSNETFRLVLEHAGGSISSISDDELLLTIVDDDGLIGVAFEPTAISVTEGSTSTYRLALTSRPSGNVTVTIIDPENTEVTAEPGTVTFTRTNWYVPQTVTVSAADDDDALNETDINIMHIVSSAHDGDYDGLTADSVTVTVMDNDGGGRGLRSSRDDDTAVVRGANDQDRNPRTEVAHVDYALVAPEPVSEDAGTVRIGFVAVTITPGNLEVDDGFYVYPLNGSATWGADYQLNYWYPDEYEDAYEELEFTSVDFKTFDDIKGNTRHRMVKYFDVNIIDDEVSEIDEAFSLTFGEGFECHSVPEIEVTIIDDDPALVTIERDGDMVTEGTDAAFTLTRSGKTDVALTVAVSVTETGEYLSGTPPPTAAFLAGAATASLTVATEDDSVDEANGSVTATLEAGTGYVVGTADQDTVSVEDDDEVGLTFDTTTLTVKEEDADGKSYEVKLASEPTSDVIIAISGHADTDLTISGDNLNADNELTFTSDNWETAQRVKVTAGEDDDAANDADVMLKHAVSSSDTLYNALDDRIVVVSITDADMAGVTVDPTTLTVVEGNDTGKEYTVKLGSEPTSDVIIALSDDGDTDLTVSGGTLSDDDELTFTSDNWNEPQRVKVTAREDDDDATNDAETISHQVSAGSAAEYVGETIAGVTVTITDNDALVTIERDAASVTEGTDATFTLTRSGKTDVALTVAVSVTETGDFISGTAPTTATFLADDTTATLTVATEGDSVDEANGSVTATLEAGTGYVVGTAGQDTVSVQDDDEVGVTVAPTTLTVVEGNDTGKEYTVKLGSEPTSDVIIALSDDGDTDLTVSGGTLSDDDELTFTSDNWNEPQRVKVTAREDDDDATNDAETISHQVSAGSAAEYVGETIAGVTVTITDNDALVTIERDAASVTEGTDATFTLTRSGKTDVALTVAVSVTETGDFISGTAPTTATFLADDTTATLTVATEGDSVDEANGSVTATLEAGTGYVVGTAGQDTVSVQDDDEVGVTVAPTTLTVVEGNDTGKEYTVKLGSEPTSDVIIALSDDGDTDLTVSGGTLSDDDELTFTSDNWNEPQRVKVTAGEDDDDATNDAETISHQVSAGSAAEYVGETIAGVTVTITDNDALVTIERDAASVTEGTDATFTLTRSGKTDVALTVAVSVTETGDFISGTAPTTATFLADDTTATLTVATEGDSVDEANGSVTATLEAGTGYVVGTAGQDTVSVQDDDEVGVTVAPTTLTVVEGDDTGKEYTVKLGSEPTSDVIIALSDDGDTDLTVSGGTLSDDDELTFTSDNWNEPQRVKVTAREDDDDATNDAETISHQVSAGSAAEYVGETIAGVTVTITDNDALVTIERDAASVTEGTDATFTLTRSGKTDVALTVAVSVTETGDFISGTAPTTATFLADDTTATLTVATEGDSVDEANGSVTATLEAGTGYVVGTAGQDTVSVQDDDEVGVTVAPTTLTVVEGDDTGKEYTVKLGSEPTSDVIIALSDDGDTDLTVSGGTLSDDDELTFTSDNWNEPQRVKVTAREDDDDATNDAETISHQVSAGSAAEYVGETIAGVTVTITDNDALVTIERDAASVTEGTDATFTLTRSGKTDVALTVAVSVTEDGDFISGTAPTTATFLADDTTTSLTVATEGDSVDEANGSVTATLEAGTGYVVGAAGQATVTVEDDDGIVEPQVSTTVSFGLDAFALPEGVSATITVVMSEAPESEVTIQIVSKGLGGATDDDYTVDPTSVTFGPTDTVQTFTFTANQDTEDDDNEKVKLTFDDPPGDVTVGMPSEIMVSINDDDEHVMNVSFEKSSYWVGEGHEVEIMVKVDPAPDHEMEIQLQKTNMHDTSDDDYSGVPSMVTFEKDETEKTFTFFAELDDEDDDEEAVELGFKDLPAMVGTASYSRALVTMRDNDGITCIDNNRAKIVTVLSRRGEIRSPGEVDSWVIPGVDPYRTYLVEILGADSSLDVWGQDVGGNLTLADPHPVSLNHEDGNPGTSRFTSAAGDFDTGRNSRFIFIFGAHGDFVLKVKSGDDQGTGSYHLLVRYDNYCTVRDDASIAFTFEGGPEGYAQDIRGDTGTRFEVNERYDRDGQRTHYFAGGHILGDNWGSEPDEDWFKFELEGDTEYEVHLEGAERFPVEHRLMRPRIVGIYDEDGEEFQAGTAVDGTDTSVSLTFRTTGSGIYYLGVGSNPGGRTGVYSFRVENTEANTAQAATNTPPTGGPGINGFPGIGEVLTATTSGIADEDGLDNVRFSYQWVRHNPLDNTDTDIPGATGSTYTVARQDRDRAIKVRVEFTDDGGNHEKLTSFALLILNTPATGQPTIKGTLEVGWTLTAETSGISDADGMDNAAFGYQWISGDSDIENATGMSHTLTEDEAGLAIRVSVTFTDDGGKKETLTSDPTGPVQPSRNAPVIRGVARVGETLAADTSGISDADGMESASFAYRWLAGGTDISGATGSNYTLTEDEEGLTMQVRVSFTDDGGNDETRTSAATEAVAAKPNKPATWAEPAITGTVRVGETLTADTSKITDADGLANVSYSYQWIAGGTDLGGATGSSYTLTVGEHGKTIQVRVRFTDDEGNPETLTSGATEGVAARPNSPATGEPAITGTVRVGETLTADTSKITDADGLENVSYQYQWVVTDRGAHLDIPGETGATYTLASSDRGLYIQVRVSFTDDADNRETLTSAMTDVVAAAR